MSLQVYKLPDAILLTIRNYLIFYLDTRNIYARRNPGNNLGKRSSISDFRSWRNFCSANKQDFSGIKELSVFYNLSLTSSRLYFKLPVNVPFGNTQALPNVTDLANFRSDQLGFRLTNHDLDELAKSATHIINQEVRFLLVEVHRPLMGGGMFGIQAPQADVMVNLSLFSDIKYLKIESYLFGGHIDVIFHPNLQLEALYSSDVPSMRFRVASEEDSQEQSQLLERCFKNTIKWVSCNLAQNLNYEWFVNAYDVDLSNSVGLVDASCFQNVHKLNLSNCKKITDVSMLGNVQSLILSGCENVTSLFALKNVQVLNIVGLTKLLEGLPEENALTRLYLDFYHWEVIGISKFIHKHPNLKIYITSPIPLRLPNLGAPNEQMDQALAALNTFMKNRAMQLQLPIIFPRCLTTPITLYQFHVPFDHLFDFHHVQCLYFEDSMVSKQWPPLLLPRLKQLTLINCYGIETILFHHLPNLEELILFGTHSLQLLHIQQSMKRLQLKQCKVNKLIIQGRVQEIKLIGCNEINYFEYQEQH